MRKRRPNGCLYAVLFIITVLICGALLIVIFSSVKSADGGSLLTEIVDRIGGNSKNDTLPDDTNTPDDSIQKDTDTDSISDLPAKEALMIELTQEKLKELLESALEDSFPLSLGEVIIASDSTLTMTGSAQRDRFIELLDGENSSLGTLERITLRLAPTEMKFEVKAKIRFDSENGAVVLEPEKLSVAGLGIPTSLLPENWITELNAALTDFLSSYNQTLTGLGLYDGYMRIYLE